MVPAALSLNAIAHQIKTSQDEVRQIRPITSQFNNFDLPTAYEVAHIIHQVRLDEGAIPVGRKIGFTNPNMWSRFGVREPIWGYIYNTTVVSLSASREKCSLMKFAEPMIEPEIVFHFHTSPPATGDLSEILECVDWIAHAFEIVQSHFPGWKFQAADTIADSALHGTLLMGEPQKVDKLGPDLISALEGFSIALSCDGKICEVGRGANVLGSPLSAIMHLIDVLSKQTQYMPLQADEIVSTGTITTAISVQAGETWRTELEGIALPGLFVEFIV